MAEKVFYHNKSHPESTTTKGSLKRRPSLLSLPLSLALHPSYPLYNMPLGNVEKPNSELEVQEHTLALNTMPDTEMTSVDQTINASTKLEPCTQTDQMPAIGDTTPVTKDLLDSITESVWQHIGQWLDAKCS